MSIAFSTASSEAVYPKLVEEMERFGCNNKIVSFVFSPTWCDNCVDVDYSSNSNQITEEMRNSVREYKSADGCFYFSLIKCQFDGKNIDLNDIKFKVY